MTAALAIPKAYGLATVTAPIENAVTLDEAKAHLRIDHDYEDAYIANLCRVGTLVAEAYQDRQFVTATYDLTIDGFPRQHNWRIDRGGAPIYLPKSPLSSVTSVKYLDENGTQQTLATTEYTVDAKTEPGRIVPAYQKTWPVNTRWHVATVTVRFVCGYGTAAQVPETTKTAIKTIISFLYENREPADLMTTVPLHVRWLLDVDRVPRLY